MVYIWPCLNRPEKLLAKDSMKQIFIKDYNHLYKFLKGIDEDKHQKCKHQNEPFSTASADIGASI
jgi:hypothetical protein